MFLSVVSVLVLVILLMIVNCAMLWDWKKILFINAGQSCSLAMSSLVIAIGFTLLSLSHRTRKEDVREHQLKVAFLFLV